MVEELTNEENIFVDIEISNFEELVEIIAQPLLENKDVTVDFPKQVIERERVFPTGLPTQPIGVAIPHTNPEFVYNNKVTIAILKAPIQMEIMGGMNEGTVDVSIVFLLALGESNKQLNILQKLMGILNQEEILKALKNSSKKEIFAFAKNELNL